MTEAQDIAMAMVLVKLLLGVTNTVLRLNLSKEELQAVENQIDAAVKEIVAIKAVEVVK